MPVRFQLFYFNDTTGRYLEEAIRAFPQGVLSQVRQLPPSLAGERNPLPLETSADVWLLEYREDVPGLDERIAEVQQLADQPAIFLYLQQADTQTLLKALRLGVQECFIGQIQPEEFQQAIDRLQKVRRGLKPGERTKVVAIQGCKGGVGTSFLAVNLAHSLAARIADPVLLLDLDLHNSDISSILDIPPRYTILDVIDNFDRLDPQYLKDIVHRHNAGLDVLPGPPRLEDRELVRAEAVENILRYVRSQNLYRWLILDLGDVLDEVTFKGLEEADLLILVVQLTVPALRDAKKMLETFQLLEIGGEKIKVVANGYLPAVAIAPKDAEKFLGQPLVAALRLDHEAVTRSLNEGLPLVELLPSNRLSGEITQLTQLIFPHDCDNGHRPGRWLKIKNLLRL
ncbi:MAG: AAA family ATPase [Desulfobacca sp.]|uniref:AAA family ATPase n=1 Tax=Desulfobacca sp. TaxID=2067990 RepID=UPI00404B563D